MKILCFGDSITDMGRDKNAESFDPWSLGYGYPYVLASKFSEESPLKHQIINRGISGNRIVDLYARIKSDVWNLKPDVLSILIGINDIWHEIEHQNGVELERFDRVFRMLIEDTKKVLPDLKIILLEPFVLSGVATVGKEDRFVEVKEYSAVIKKIAQDFDCEFVSLQEKFDERALKYGADKMLWDGVHPTVAGSTLIANEWLKTFKAKVER